MGDTCGFLKLAFADLMELQTVQAEALAAAGPAVPQELQTRLNAAADRADLEYLQERVPPAFERASDGISRVASIVGAMRVFAHPPTKDQLPVHLNEALRTTLVISANTYKYVADIETDYGELPAVTCNGGDLNQVFLNLIVNAAHAIEDRVGDSGERGTITVRTRQDGTDVVISIGNDGGPIPDEIAARIFDPFFTTKDVGRGTGQGLAIARTLVNERHGGTLTFETGEHGTTFHVRLPIAGAPAAAPAKPGAADAQAA